ncbi:MAG: hypothetical protein AAF514_17020 [Verrucomicrobiota bacterium]
MDESSQPEKKADPNKTPATSPDRPEITELTPSESAEGVDLKKLSKEEQMAQFEKALRESDWGHQPC